MNPADSTSEVSSRLIPTLGQRGSDVHPHTHLWKSRFGAEEGEVLFCMTLKKRPGGNAKPAVSSVGVKIRAVRTGYVTG